MMSIHIVQMSRLVVSEVIRGCSIQSRVAVIEKWVAVADICRCLHNFNGVLQVCAAFQNSSVFRLKKTWEKVSKNVRRQISDELFIDLHWKFFLVYDYE